MTEPDPDEVVLRSDALEVVVLPEAGARVHSIRVHGYELLRTAVDSAVHLDDPFYWGGYHMIPWANRLDPGPQQILGQRVHLRRNHPDGSAIHGLEYAARWEHVDAGRFQISGGQGATGWPWTYDAAIVYGLDGATLTIDYALTNTAERAMPAGLGFHPWFRTPSTLQIPSAWVFADNNDPAVRPSPVTGALDLREPAPVAVGTDACWVDLTEPAVTLAWDDLGLQLTMAADDPAIVAVAARLSEIDAVAVELQTHAPAGVRRLLNAERYAMHALAPGDTLRLRLTLAFSR